MRGRSCVQILGRWQIDKLLGCGGECWRLDDDRRCDAVLLNLEPPDRRFKALAEIDRWLPAEALLCTRDVGPAPRRIVLRKRTLDDGRKTSRERDDAVDEKSDRELFRIADVDRGADILAVHKPNDSFDGVVH